MKFFLLSIIAWLFLFNAAPFALTDEYDREDEKDRAMPELWFPVGERLTYNISWGPVTFGTTVISSEWLDNELTIRVRTRSTRFFDRIFKVDDVLESIVDPQTFTPLRFTKRLHEGSHRLHEVTSFDHESGTAVWTNLLTGASRELAIEKNTRCLLSFMFYKRAFDFEPDSEYRFRLMADENIHDLDVFSRSYEVVKLDGIGDVRSLLLEPEAPFHGLFVRVANVQLWVSADDRAFCTQATASILVGRIRVSLISVEGPDADLWMGTVKK